MDNQSEASQGKIIPIVYAQGLAEERVKAVVSEKLAGRSFALCSYADTFYPDISIRKNVRMLRASTKGRERELFNELINLTGWKKKSSWIRPFRAHMTGEKRLFSVILTAILAGDALVLPEPFVGLAINGLEFMALTGLQEKRLKILNLSNPKLNYSREILY